MLRGFHPIQVVPSERSVESSWHRDAGDICSQLIESRFHSHTSCNRPTVCSDWERGKAGSQLLIFYFRRVKKWKRNGLSIFFATVIITSFFKGKIDVLSHKSYMNSFVVLLSCSENLPSKRVNKLLSATVWARSLVKDARLRNINIVSEAKKYI